MYNNLNSSAVKSIKCEEKEVKVTYNSNTSKEYTFISKNVLEFEDSLCKELIAVEMKTGGSVGRFLHNQIKEGLLVESK
jgi:hypothetical protein|tara:strand:+ start:133 stop:369 length:237 start_codon:yes stop_codon:yes gene_type:complete